MRILLNKKFQSFEALKKQKQHNHYLLPGNSSKEEESTFFLDIVRGQKNDSTDADTFRKAS